MSAETLELFTMKPDTSTARRIKQLLAARWHGLNCPFCGSNLEDETSKHFDGNWEELIEVTVECSRCGSPLTVERCIDIQYTVTGERPAEKVDPFSSVEWTEIEGLSGLLQEHAAYTGIAAAVHERSGNLVLVETPCIETNLGGKYLLLTSRGKALMLVTEQYLAQKGNQHA